MPQALVYLHHQPRKSGMEAILVARSEEATDNPLLGPGRGGRRPRQ